MRKKQISFITLIALFTSVFLYGTVCMFKNVDAKEISVNMSANKSAQIYVHSFKINNKNILVGGDISGSFTISNAGEIDVSDAYYTVSVLKKETDNIVTDSYSETGLKTLEYIKANSKRDIVFNYTLPKYLFGDNFLLIKVYLQDGTVLSTGVEKIYIQGEPQSNLIESGVSVLVNERSVSEMNNLVFSQADQVKALISLKNSNKKTQQKYSLIIHKDGWGGTIANEPVLLKANFDKDSKYSINIPTTLPAGKYLAEIKFENNGADDIRTIIFEYIVNGLTSNIETINSNPLTVSNGEDMILSVKYKGYGPTDEDYIKKLMNGATLNLKISNENDLVVSEVNSPIDLSLYNNEITLNTKANTRAEFLTVYAEIRDSNNNIVSSYANDLPSEKELDLLYPEKMSIWKIVLNILILIILILVILWLRKYSATKIKKTSTILTGLLLIISLVSFVPKTSSAYTEASVSSTAFSTLNLISYINSPLPSNISSYAPGQSFKLNVGLQKTRVDNGGWSKLEYMTYSYLLPDSNSWIDWNKDGLNSNSGTQLPQGVFQIVGDVTYTAPSAPGLYNFNFYVIGKKISASKDGEQYVIKKITQPILVEIPYNQIAGTKKSNTSDLNITTACSNEHTDGQKVCDFGTVGTWKCQPAIDSCVIDSVAISGNKIISTANVLNFSSGVSNVDISISQNISGIKSGDKFYIITDLLDSSWINKQYVYSEFIYGKAEKNFIKQGTRKSNEHTVSYDGSNKVTITSKYIGKESNFTTAKFAVKEIGLIDSNSCRNIIASEADKMFVSANEIGAITMCANPKYTLFSNSTRLDDLYAAAQGGSHSKGRTASMSMNVCDSSEIKNLEINRPFYVVVDSNGTDWIQTRYDFFNFSKGVPKTQTFSAPSKKYNVITGDYDGACTVNFSSRHAGKDSNYTRAVVDIIEVGLMNSDLCYNPGVSYPSNFNRGNTVPSIPMCKETVTTCATDSNWLLQPNEGSCSSFLSCLIKNSSGNKATTFNAGDSISYDVDYATTGDKSLFQYSWNFGSAEDANPTYSNSKLGTLTYSTPGQKNIDVKITLNNEILDQTTCPSLNITCESGNCSAGCGTEVVGLGQGLSATNNNLCPAGQNLVVGSFDLLGFSSNSPTVWSWKCKSDKNEKTCNARCAEGLTYCPATGVCSSGGCNGDMCLGITGTQSVTDPVYSILGCRPPSLDLKVKFNKPYANDNSKCSINWSTETNPSKANSFTTCSLNGKSVSSNESNYLINVGKYEMKCITEVSAAPTEENPNPQSVKSDPEIVKFECSRASKTIEN